MNNFFLESETNEQEQNISLNPNLRDTLLWKAFKLSLASRSNQDGISKSKSALLLTETIVIDRNSKEHPSNTKNQKESFPNKTDIFPFFHSNW